MRGVVLRIHDYSQFRGVRKRSRTTASSRLRPTRRLLRYRLPVMWFLKSLEVFLACVSLVVVVIGAVLLVFKILGITLDGQDK